MRLQGAGGVEQNVAPASYTGLSYNGELILSGANTYTGATTVGCGTLVIGPGGGLGNTAITVLEGATLRRVPAAVP